MDIKVLESSLMNGFEVNDEIIIQEKIDGSNFSILYDRVTDSLRGFSRRLELTPNNTLRGAYDWMMSLNKEKVKEVLGENLILFMEWLTPHSIKYPKECYNQPYCFDVYNTSTLSYLPQKDVKEIVSKLSLNYVPVFYEGPFISWNHAQSFVGKTYMGGETGEGVVVKNMTKLKDPQNRKPYYLKIVISDFVEKRKMKSYDPEKIKESEEKRLLSETIVTKGRVIKLLHKMVDEGILRENWDESDVLIIKKNLSRALYYDCVKEEPEIVEKVGKTFGMYANQIGNQVLKDILNEKFSN